MLSKIFRKRAVEVDFCESCGQVCTSACRAEARIERTRAQIAYQLPIIR